jgi:hypothetical protein
MEDNMEPGCTTLDPTPPADAGFGEWREANERDDGMCKEIEAYASFARASTRYLDHLYHHHCSPQDQEAADEYNTAFDEVEGMLNTFPAGRQLL